MNNTIGIDVSKDWLDAFGMARAEHRRFANDGEGLRQIAEIYAIEKDIRGTSPGQRLSARQARSAPLVAAFGDWLQAVRLRVSKKSRLGEKLAYIHNHWARPQTFLADGRVEIDSNIVENLVRPIALNRKKCTICRPRRRRRGMGPHRFPDRNLQDQRHRALRLPEIYTRSDRRRPHQKPHRRTAPLELPAVNMKIECSPAAAYLRGQERPRRVKKLTCPVDGAHARGIIKGGSNIGEIPEHFLGKSTH